VPGFYFHLILWIFPRPDGLSEAGMAVLAVVVWASIMWVSEALPVGITGISVPTLLILTRGTVDRKERQVRTTDEYCFFWVHQTCSMVMPVCISSWCSNAVIKTGSTYSINNIR